MSTFTIRKPKAKEKRASFFVFRFDKVNGKRKGKALQIPELDLVNERYRDGTLRFQEALALIENIRKKLSQSHNGPKTKPVTNSENLRLLERYWDREYTYRDISAPKSMEYSLRKALRAIGNISLLICSESELYKKLKNIEKPNDRRRVISRLNQLLRFAGRDFKLKLPKQDYLEVRYLNRAEFAKLVSGLSEFDQHAATLAFATGCRVGEMFGLSELSLRGRFRLFIGHQITDELKKAPTKNRKARSITMHEFGERSLTYWLALSQEEKFSHRNRRLSDVVKFRARELWPDKEEKHICFHDLRHCYAIEMLRRGASLTQVAQLLGDCIQVVQAYYTGFSMVDESLDALDAHLTKNA